MTVRGKIQRVAAKDISVIGRNTQGVRIMSLDEGDTLTAIVRVPPEDISEMEVAKATPVSDNPNSSIPTDDESATEEPTDGVDSDEGNSEDEGQS